MSTQQEQNRTYLAEADQLLANAEARVANARARIADLERLGGDATSAREGLEELEAMLKLMRRRRDTIAQLVANPEGPMPDEPKGD
jgi:hypothetical protein